MGRPRKRLYYVEVTLEGDEFDVIRSVEGSPHTAVIETFGSEIMASRAAATLQSFANADYQMRLDALAKKAKS